MTISNSVGRSNPYQYANYTALTWVVVALRTATLICGIALLALMIFHRKIIIVRILAVALGLFILANDVIIGITSYSSDLDLRVFSIPSAVLLIALAVPVFCASFRQWCAGTWTAPAWKPSAVAGRPTILARCGFYELSGQLIGFAGRRFSRAGQDKTPPNTASPRCTPNWRGWMRLRPLLSDYSLYTYL